MNKELKRIFALLPSLCEFVNDRGIVDEVVASLERKSKFHEYGHMELANIHSDGTYVAMVGNKFHRLEIVDGDIYCDVATNPSTPLYETYLFSAAARAVVERLKITA